MPLCFRLPEKFWEKSTGFFPVTSYRPGKSGGVFVLKSQDTVWKVSDHAFIGFQRLVRCRKLCPVRDDNAKRANAKVMDAVSIPFYWEGRLDRMTLIRCSGLIVRAEKKED
jgi:hypothetical protein